MRRSLVSLLALCIAGAVSAATAPTANRMDLEGKGSSPGDGAMSPRVGGEDIGTAALIPALPFNDTGATCGYINNYDEDCPYTGSTSPDVVYKYTPSTAEAITIDLCASQYDTKVYVYAGGVGNLIGCNDDANCGYSGWQSKLENISLTAGVTYYVVVDGYGGACGTYDMHVESAIVGCLLVCPEGAIQEGEPPCGPDYVDNYNGGCNSNPHVFQALAAQDQGCVELCGESGTYTYYGLSYRDTDWFEVIGTGTTVEASCISDYWPLQFIFIWNADCDNLQYDIVTAPACEEVTLSHFAAEGVPQWLWVGAQVFTGIPCGSVYLLNVCGIAGPPPPVPVQETTWGGIKSRYR